MFTLEDTKRTIKSAAVYVGLAVVLIGGGFAFGRWATPARVVVQERVRVETVEKQVVVTQVKTEVQIVRVKDVIKATAVDTHTERRPDGTVTTDTHVREASKAEEHTNTNATQNATQSATTAVQQTTAIDKKTTTDYRRPSWSVSVLPGFDFAGALKGDSGFSLMPADPALRHAVLGATLEKRFWGPLFVGIWATSQGVGGIALRMEF